MREYQEKNIVNSVSENTRCRKQHRWVKVSRCAIMNFTMSRVPESFPSRQSSRFPPEAGFTLVEICVAMGLTGILAVALADISTFSNLTTQANNAIDEFNKDASLLFTIVSANVTDSGNTSNGCTNVFLGMPIVGGVPQISTSLPLPAPSPLGTYISTINLPGEQPVALHTLASNPASSIIIQVGAPSTTAANASFPPPHNNLWITNIAFKSLVDAGIATGTVNGLASTENLYDLNISAQKVSTGHYNIMGGQTSYSKDFLVALWVGNASGTVNYCGPNPPP